MRINIEELVILALVITTLIFIAIIQLTKLIKLWRYKKENDKGKLAEESRRRSNTEYRDVQGTILPQRRSIFSFARPINKPESSGVTGKNSRRFRNPFTRK
jgi:hypothetical protein